MSSANVFNLIKPKKVLLAGNRLSRLKFTDANKIITGLPVLRSDYGVQDADIAFLRKFFRCNDTQTLMKVSIVLFMLYIFSFMVLSIVKTYEGHFLSS